MNKLTREELIRYSRHLVLENFGLESQQKLKNARVLVVGAGGLGCPALLYLAAAGVGTIGVVDFDVIQESNLQRQILFSFADIGKSKAEVAGQKLIAQNPYIAVNIYPEKLTRINCLEIVKKYDIILDGSDNFPTRYLVNDACVLADKVLVYGSILQYEGQVSVFNSPSGKTRSSNYRDLFPEPPAPNEVPNCEQAGVLGVLPGIIGSLMATETIKIITNIGDALVNRLLILDLITLETTQIKIPNRNSRNSIADLIDYDSFCGVNVPEISLQKMKEITVKELKAALDSKEDIQLIDVREIHENELSNIGGKHIPMAEVPMNTDKIETDKKVVVYCRSGARSGNIINWLEKNKNLTNLYNLKGGMLAWRNEIDSSVNVA
ncbi:MAG: ThiF family adenylyltransferase [Cyclobacteriaceae bacterium]|nr:ThiF family adenylyltransferase [Cyclobacteriaceae bacterium]